MDYASQVLMWFQVVCIIDMKTQPLGSYVGVLGVPRNLVFIDSCHFD